MNIVAVSDLHLGTMVNLTKTKRLIKIINDLNPDLVLIGGDIIDDNLKVVKYFELLTHFKDIKGISLYLVNKYGIKSIAIWNYEEK